MTEGGELTQGPRRKSDGTPLRNDIPGSWCSSYRGKGSSQRLAADCREENLVQARKVKAESRTAVPASGQRRGKQKGVVPNSPEAPQS